MTFATTHEYALPEYVADGFLHDRPSLGEHEPTIVLGNGSRYFLRSRAATEGSGQPLSGNLLSAPMRSLQKEAEALQLDILTKRRASEVQSEDASSYLANEVILNLIALIFIPCSDYCFFVDCAVG